MNWNFEALNSQKSLIIAGMIGPQELLIILFLVLVIWIIIKFIPKVSKIEKLITKRFEISFLKNSKKDKIQETTNFKIRSFPFPFVIIGILCYLIFASIIYSFVADNTPIWIAIFDSILSYLLSFGGLIIGLILHFKPGSNRYLKYNFLIFSSTFLTFTLLYKLFVMIKTIKDFYGLGEYIEPLAVSFTLIFFLIFIVLVQIISSNHVRKIFLGKDNSIINQSNKFKLFYKIRKAGKKYVFLSFTLFAQPFLTYYLINRYLIGEIMKNEPILYLRSFHYKEGPSAFGKIVARVASRYSILLAIVHSTQRPLELHAETSITERAELAIVPDEDWQSWIETQMLRASAIIIDYSIISQGLTWELDRAISILELSKIILLYHRGTEINTQLNIWKLEYEFGKNNEARARTKLDEHFKELFLSKKEL